MPGGHRSGRGDPRPVPTWAVATSPLPPCPAEPFPSPLPCLAPLICCSLGRGRGGTGWSWEPSCRAGAWRSQEKLFLQWSWKTHPRGHRRDEPPPVTGTLCPAQHPLPGLWGPGHAAPATTKCKKEKHNGKSKNSVRVQPLSHGRCSSSLETLFSLFLEQGSLRSCGKGCGSRLARGHPQQ